jgi:hypothetical protein
MTLSEEAKEIRSEVARLRPKRGRKYKREFRQRVVDWYARAQESGMLASDCMHAVGLSIVLIEKWRDAERRIAATMVPSPEVPRPSASTALVPVVMRDDLPFGPMIAFSAPGGYRIEGLTLEQAIGLLRLFG